MKADSNCEKKKKLDIYPLRSNSLLMSSESFFFSLSREFVLDGSQREILFACVSSHMSQAVLHTKGIMSHE